MTTSLINEIIKEPGIYFRGIALGDLISKAEKKEGHYAEKKLYSNPFIRYDFEIGEMEEMFLYYNFLESDELVNEITLHFIHYPDYYWKKEGNSMNDFHQLVFEKHQIPSSQVFEDTLKDVIIHFTEAFKKEPSIITTDSVFKEAYHNYRCYRWEIENDVRLSVMTYCDDSDTSTMKNTMKISLRRF